MFITTIEVQTGSKIESLESWDGSTENESVNRAIKSAEQQNVSADSIVSITTKQV
jgi:hypothetical protein